MGLWLSTSELTELGTMDFWSTFKIFILYQLSDNHHFQSFPKPGRHYACVINWVDNRFHFLHLWDHHKVNYTIGRRSTLRKMCMFFLRRMPPSSLYKQATVGVDSRSYASCHILELRSAALRATKILTSSRVYVLIVFRAT